MEYGQNQPNTPVTPTPENGSETLEQQTTVVAPAEQQVAITNDQPELEPLVPTKKIKKHSVKALLARFNIYLLLFALILLIAIAVTVISYIRSRQSNSNPNTLITTEPLSKEALEQLRQTDVKLGDPKQVLTVESNAIFAGTVLIRNNLEVAGEIKAGSALNIPGLSVSGVSNLNQVQASQLQISGNTTLQGQVAIHNNLNVTGSATFGGVVSAAGFNVQSLQLSGDIQLNRHIDAGGGTPGKSDGSALGSGGTSSVSGTDTAGTLSVNTGGGTNAGCFATINFTQRFNATPHVVVTPIGSAGGSLNYYVNRSAANFSICTANAAPAGQSFAFDYIVID